MASRNFQKKKRNEVKRKRKSVMLITAEGRNKTEKQYFSSFQNQYSKYCIRFVKGLETDPLGMLKTMKRTWEKNELSEIDGDKAYIVLRCGLFFILFTRHVSSKIAKNQRENWENTYRDMKRTWMFLKFFSLN